MNTSNNTSDTSAEDEGLTNLAKETKLAIKDSGHKVSDVAGVFDRRTGVKVSLSKFLREADRFYDQAGCWEDGTAEINPALVISFSDGSFLQRMVSKVCQYECWEHYAAPGTAKGRDFQIFMKE